MSPTYAPTSTSPTTSCGADIERRIAVMSMCNTQLTNDYIGPGATEKRMPQTPKAIAATRAAARPSERALSLMVHLSSRV